MSPSNNFVISARDVKKQFVQVVDRPQSVKSYLVDLCTGKAFSRKKVYSKVLNGITFDVFPGEVLGIMGRNGAGKSTLFRLLSGIYKPDSGSIQVTEKMAALIGLGAGFHPELTGYENIFLNGSVIGFGRSEIASVVDEIVEFAELGDQINLPVKNYSSGMVLRLGFSIAAHVNAQIILLDEILGVGDEGFQRKSLNKILELIASGRTVILITHETTAVLKYCTRCMVIDHGQVIFDGDAKQGVAHYSALFA